MNTIGILKEPQNDPRVCMLPETVKKLCSAGVRVLFESQAGTGLGILNVDYQKAGAVCTTAEKIYEEADLVCSINHRYENEQLWSQVNFVGIFNPLFHTNQLNRYTQWTSVYSLDLLPRTTLAQSMDVLSSMASLAGYKAVLMAAYYAKGSLPMFTTAAGTIKPAKVLVLGAGVAGLQAIATAKRIGAVVEAFDVRKSAGEEVRSLGAKYIEVEGALESENAGGYAIEQNQDFLDRQSQLIHEAAVEADVIISTANIPGKKAPLLITQSTVEHMKKGAVIIDMASEQGGNCELSQNNKVVQFNDITIVGNSHLSKTVPMSASQLLSNNYYNYVQLFLKDSSNQLIKSTQLIERGEFIHPMLQNLATQKVVQ